MRKERVHLHNAASQIICGAAEHNRGTLALSTDVAPMVTCGPCLTLLAEARRIGNERRLRIMLALDDLYRSTPWWALATRHLIRQALVKAEL